VRFRTIAFGCGYLVWSMGSRLGEGISLGGLAPLMGNPLWLLTPLVIATHTTSSTPHSTHLGSSFRCTEDTASFVLPSTSAVWIDTTYTRRSGSRTRTRKAPHTYCMFAYPSPWLHPLELCWPKTGLWLMQPFYPKTLHPSRICRVPTSLLYITRENLMQRVAYTKNVAHNRYPDFLARDLLRVHARTLSLRDLSGDPEVYKSGSVSCRMYCVRSSSYDKNQDDRITER
jgi:hypothetical protein